MNTWDFTVIRNLEVHLLRMWQERWMCVMIRKQVTELAAAEYRDKLTATCLD